MSKDSPLPDCKQILTSEKLLPLTFTILAYHHCHCACDPLVSSVLTYNLINSLGTGDLVVRHPIP